jgi:hypothetical protein
MEHRQQLLQDLENNSTPPLAAQTPHRMPRGLSLVRPTRP